MKFAFELNPVLTLMVIGTILFITGILTIDRIDPIINNALFVLGMIVITSPIFLSIRVVVR